MAELIPVNIVIADRTYRLKIAPADEEQVRRTVKEINTKILEYKSSFAGKDLQDYVAMALLWFATEKVQTGGPDQGIFEKLGTIEEMLNSALE